MNDREMRRCEMFSRLTAFGEDHAGSFTVQSKTLTCFAGLKAIATKLNAAARAAKGIAFLALGFLLGDPAAHAGLTFELYLYSANQNYVFYTPLTTNATPPAAPLGNYFIYSPQQPTNGAWRQFKLTADGITTLGGGEDSYADFDSAMQQITTGAWRIVVTNATSTNTYEFTVSAPNVSSNLLPLSTVTFPADGATEVTNQPTFTWQVPINWPVMELVWASQFDAAYNYTFFQSASLPSVTTSWTIPVPIPGGTNTTFTVRATTNYAAPLFVATTPTNTVNGQPLAGWDSATTLESGASVHFTTVLPENPAASLGGALNAPQLGWTTSGSPWFVATNVTHDGVASAQSGVVTNDQTSTLQTTVTGPVGVTFWWHTAPNGVNFELDFVLDGEVQDSIFADQPWSQKDFTIGPGTHTLQWVAAANGDTDPDGTGWVDQASLVPVGVVRASASPTVGQFPLTVQFTSAGVDSLGNTITGWSWDFGDGFSSTAQNPSHTYTAAGTFSPRLTVQAGFNPFWPATTGPGVITATRRAVSDILTSLPGSPVAFTYNNFSNAASLEFLGSAARATTSDGPVLQLTSAASGQSGAVYSAIPLPLAGNAGFATFFTFRLSHGGGIPGGEDVLGADGICFVLQGSGYQIASDGGNLGYFGITSSLAVEFDTFNNGAGFGTPGDRDGNHVAINVNGALNDPVSVHIPHPMNNGNVWYAWIDYYGEAKRLEVRLSEVPIRPLTNTLVVTVDLPLFLGTTNAFAGFTGSTGAGWNQQDILSWKFLALPTTRLTGQLTLTNSSPDFYLTNGMAIKQYRYPVNGIWYTNIYLAAVTFTEQVGTDGSVVENYESGPESSPIPPFEFALGQDVYSDGGYWNKEDLYTAMTTALLSQYRDYLTGTGQIEGVGVFAGSGRPSDQDLIDRLSHEDWSVTFPGLDEHEVHDALGYYDEGWNDSTQQLLNMADDTLWLSGGSMDDYYTYEQSGILPESFSYSTATYRGHALTREQIILAPPLPIKLLSPRLLGTNFQFLLRTVLNQSYTVWASTNVAATNWVSYTNFTGDGYLKKITAPNTDSPHRFYRVSSP